MVCRYVLLSVGSLSTLLTVSVDAQSCLSFHEVRFACFVGLFATCACGVLAKKLLPNPVLWSFCFQELEFFVDVLAYLVSQSIELNFWKDVS